MDIVKSMVYPGRIIIIGTAPAGQRVVLYSITGRSPSSQARRLEIDKQAGSIFVKPTDEQTLKTGNPDLLVYPAMIWDSHNGVAVSNGKQTRDVANMLAADSNPLDVLVGSLSSWEYEPDDPNFTPAHQRLCDQGRQCRSERAQARSGRLGAAQSFYRAADRGHGQPDCRPIRGKTLIPCRHLPASRKRYRFRGPRPMKQLPGSMIAGPQSRRR